MYAAWHFVFFSEFTQVCTIYENSNNRSAPDCFGSGRRSIDWQKVSSFFHIDVSVGSTAICNSLCEPDERMCCGTLLLYDVRRVSRRSVSQWWDDAWHSKWSRTVVSVLMCSSWCVIYAALWRLANWLWVVLVDQARRRLRRDEETCRGIFVVGRWFWRQEVQPGKDLQVNVLTFTSHSPSC